MKKITHALPLVLVFLLLTPSLVLAAEDDPRSEGEIVDLKGSDFSPSFAEDLQSSLAFVAADDLSSEGEPINLKGGLDASPNSTEDLQKKSKTTAIEASQAWDPPCNQGAPCTEGCGPEGFCHQASGCCMCY